MKLRGVTTAAAMAFAMACQPAEQGLESRMGESRPLPDSPITADEDSPQPTLQDQLESASTEGLQLTFDGPITAIAQTSTGEIYIAGDFLLNDKKHLHLIRLLRDGSIDPDFTVANSTAFDGPIYALAVGTEDEIFVGGHFTFYRDKEVGGLVKLDSAGMVDEQWNTNLGTGFDGPVLSLTYSPQVGLVVGGEFHHGSGTPHPGLAFVDPGDGFPAATPKVMTDSDTPEIATDTPEDTPSPTPPSPPASETPEESSDDSPADPPTDQPLDLSDTDADIAEADDFFESDPAPMPTSTPAPAPTPLDDGPGRAAPEPTSTPNIIVEITIVLNNLGSTTPAPWEEQPLGDLVEEDAVDATPTPPPSPAPAWEARQSPSPTATAQSPSPSPKPQKTWNERVAERKERFKTKIRLLRTQLKLIKLKRKDVRTRAKLYRNTAKAEDFKEAIDRLETRIAKIKDRLTQVRERFQDYKAKVKERRQQLQLKKKQQRQLEKERKQQERQAAKAARKAEQERKKQEREAAKAHKKEKKQSKTDGVETSEDDNPNTHSVLDGMLDD